MLMYVMDMADLWLYINYVQLLVYVGDCSHNSSNE